LLTHAVTGDVVSASETAFGRKYLVQGPLSAPDGRRPNICSVWFVEIGEHAPRLVTAYPLARIEDDQGT
jgi:hypothetical protein